MQVVICGADVPISFPPLDHIQNVVSTGHHLFHHRSNIDTTLNKVFVHNNNEMNEYKWLT